MVEAMATGRSMPDPITRTIENNCKKTGDRINKIYPDNSAYGILIPGIDVLNRLLKGAGNKQGYCQISGSLMDGSFYGLSRRKKFDIDLTWIINHNTLRNVKLRSAKQNTNYVHASIFRSPEQVQSAYSRVLEKFLEVYFKGKSAGDWYDNLNKIVHFDITPAIACDFRSTAFCAELLCRLMKIWDLSDKAFQEVLNADLYLIPKAMDKSKELKTWRLSFSSVENILFREMSTKQRRSYAIFKLVAENIGIMNARPDYLTTYHLKNIMFWSVEEGSKFWLNPDMDLGHAVYCLLCKLRVDLSNGRIRLYFLPDANILPEVDASDSEFIIQRIDQFLESPDYILQVVPPFPFVEAELQEGTTLLLHILAGHLTMLITSNVVGMMLYHLTHSLSECFQRGLTGRLFVQKICELICINDSTVDELQLPYLKSRRYDDHDLDSIKAKISETVIGSNIKDMPLLTDEDRWHIYCGAGAQPLFPYLSSLNIIQTPLLADIREGVQKVIHDLDFLNIFRTRPLPTDGDHRQTYSGAGAQQITPNPALKLLRKDHLDAIYDLADFLVELFEKVKRLT